MQSHDSWNDGSTDFAQRERLRQKLADDLGIPLPEWEDELQAPRLDESAIRSLYNKQLDHENELRVTELIFQFRSWADAYCRIGMEQQSQHPQS